VADTWGPSQAETQEDLVIRWSRIVDDTCQDRGGGIADTLLQRGLVVWASVDGN
jgi:hypothetical protein